MRVLWRVVVKEFLQLRRDRRMVPMIFLAPVVQILAFGYAVNTDVTDVPTLLVDLDRTRASRDLAERFFASGYFRLAGTEDAAAAAEPWMVAGRAQMALVIGRGYGEAIAAGRSPAIQVVADGSDANSAMVGLGYASGIVAQASADLRRDRPGGAAPAGARIALEPRVWYNPDLKSRWFYVPAVLAMVLMSMTLVLSAMGIVREKEIGTLEQVLVTPIRSWQLVAGKLAPFAVIGLIDTFLVTAVALWWFRVPLRGSLGLLVTLTMLFVLNTLGLGLLISTLVRNQQQAMMAATFVVMVPMIYLSGLIFPIENMPPAIRWVTYAIPLRYFAVILRGVFLKGSGLAALWPQAAALLAFGAGFLALAAARFHKRAA